MTTRATISLTCRGRGTTMIQLDPNQAGTVNSGAAVIHFSSRILGLALFSSTLDATDVYGHAGTLYPTGNSARGIEKTRDDKFTIAGSGLSVTVNLTANNFDFDEIRVFTAAPVPEPASLTAGKPLIRNIHNLKLSETYAG